MDFLGGVVRNSNIEPHLCPLTSGIQGPLMAHLLLSIESAGRRGRGSGGRGRSTESLMATAAGRKKYFVSRV